MSNHRVILVRDSEVVRRLNVLQVHFNEVRCLPSVSLEKLASCGIVGYREYGFLQSNVDGEVFPILGGKEWDMLYEFDMVGGCTLRVAFHYTASFMDDLYPRLANVAGYLQCTEENIDDREIARLLRLWHQLVEPNAAKRRTTATRIMPVYAPAAS